jgi:hypothetical protein
MNTSEMINAIKIKGSFPTSDDLFSDDDFLVLLNHQFKTEIFPLMISLSEEYFLLSKDYSVTQGGLYRIPSRAIGAKLRDVQYLDASNNVQDLNRLFEEDRKTTKSGFYIVRNSIELTDDYTSNTLRLKYFGRPNKLVLTTDCAQITSIDSATQVTTDFVPGPFTDALLVDFVQNNNPYDLLSYDQSLVGVSGLSLTFNSLPDGLEVGDWVCIAQTSPVAMVPEEIQPILIQSALVSCLASKKDKSLEYEAAVLERIKLDAKNMMDPRVENDSIKFRTGNLLGYFSDRWY